VALDYLRRHQPGPLTPGLLGIEGIGRKGERAKRRKGVVGELLLSRE
jgi:hypothetical protein